MPDQSKQPELEGNSLKKGYCGYCDSTWTTADPTLPCPSGCNPAKPPENSLLGRSTLVSGCFNQADPTRIEIEWAKNPNIRPYLVYDTWPASHHTPEQIELLAQIQDAQKLWSYPRDSMKALQPKEPLQDQIGGTHYKKLKIQPVEYVHANQLGYFEGTAIKYLSRWKDKGGLEDLRKAIHFIELLISLEEQKNEDGKQ